MSLFNQSEKAYLLLADGQIFEGRSFGAKGTVIGEVVFTTSLTGYEETLTDPSYYGQIVTQTFPLIGNYGVNEADKESDKSYVSGYIVREWCNAPSNFRMEGDINTFLEKENIIGLHNIDTRRLTRTIREAGVMNGVITTANVYEKKDEFLEKSEDVSDAEIKEALINDAAEKKLEGRISKREIAERGFMELLDSDSYREKYLIFIGLRNYIDKRLLNNIAVALDIVIDDTDEEQQYDSILRCLQTFDKFETNRLR